MERAVMAEIKKNVRLGACFRRYREDAGLTQEEAAQVSGLKRDYINGLEGGRILVPYPPIVNALRRVYRFPGWEVLEEMGYHTDAQVNNILPALQVLVQQMSNDEQQALLGVARAMRKN